MTTIGAAWTKENKNGEHYISIKLDESILPLTITDNKMITLKVNKSKKDTRQPDFYVDIFIPKKQTATQSTPEQGADEPETPFF